MKKSLIGLSLLALGLAGGAYAAETMPGGDPLGDKTVTKAEFQAKGTEMFAKMTQITTASSMLPIALHTKARCSTGSTPIMMARSHAMNSWRHTSPGPTAIAPKASVTVQGTEQGTVAA